MHSKALLWRDHKMLDVPHVRLRSESSAYLHIELLYLSIFSG